MTHYSPTEARESAEHAPNGPEPAPTPERASDGRTAAPSHTVGTCSCGTKRNRPAEYDAPDQHAGGDDVITDEQWHAATAAVMVTELTPQLVRLRQERDRARDIAVELENQLAAVQALHRPVDGMGWHDGDYGDMTGCSSCGVSGDNAVPWPCPTVRALDGEEVP